MAVITSGTPHHYAMGVNDKSGGFVPIPTGDIPQHLSKFYLPLPKGPMDPHIVDAAGFKELYGSEALDIKSKWWPKFNQTNLFMTGIMAQASKVMVQRLVPEDSGPKAHVVLWLDIVKKKVSNYARNSDGSIVYQEDGETPVLDSENPKIDGHVVQWIKEFYPTGIQETGVLKSKTGTLKDDDGNPSTMYPVFEATARSYGEAYNNFGFAIESLTNDEIPEKIISETKVLPFKFKLYSRPDTHTTPSVVKTNNGDIGELFTFKEAVINPLTNGYIDFDSIFPNRWVNETDSRFSYRYDNYNRIYLYKDNIKNILSDVIKLEATYITDVSETKADGLDSDTRSWFDYTTSDQTDILDELYLTNIITCRSSKNVRYFTLQYNEDNTTSTAYTAPAEVSGDTPIMLRGGNNGSLFDSETGKMDQSIVDSMIINELHKYSDKSSTVMNTARNKESIIYDCGYSMDIKYAMVDFISIRKDTSIALTTHIVSGKDSYKSLGEHIVTAQALMGKVLLAPESTYFGTKTIRAIISAGSGKLANSDYKDRVPLLYDIAIKNAKYMGSSNGFWKANKSYDRQPGSNVTELIDIEPNEIPQTTKSRLWASEIIWPEPNDQGGYFYPAMQTVYTDDTSVVNNAFIMFAICYLEKVHDRIWREMTGDSELSRKSFEEIVKSKYVRLTTGRFANRYSVTPDVFFTDDDVARGFSWGLVSRISGQVMKTVQHSSIEVYRAE